MAVMELLRRLPMIRGMADATFDDDLATEGAPAALRAPPLRIALVTETYPPEVNGVAMSVARLVTGLRAREHHVQLVRPRQPHDGEAFTPEALLTRAWPIPRYPHLRMGAPSPRVLLRAWSLQRPDVVHIATEGPLGASALMAARRLKLPVTTDFRTNFHAYGEHYRAGWLARPIAAYLRHFHNRAHCTMVPTQALHEALSGQHFERLLVVGRGIDTRLFDPQRRSDDLRTQWGARADTLVVASIGRLAAEKNLEVTLQAHDAVRDALPNTRMLFVGEGPMGDALRARCPQAHFAGQRSGEDLAAHYASADLFLFPSLTETYGNVTAEAMASGLPVLAFDCAAAGQLIRSGRNGLLVSCGDTPGYARAAVALAADRPRRTALGAAARASVLGLGWDHVVQRLEAVLFQAAGATLAGQAETRCDTAPLPLSVLASDSIDGVAAT